MNRPQPPNRAVILANPAAGATDPLLVESVARLCREHSVTADVRWTTRRGGAADLAAEVLAGPAEPSARPDLVVSVGGDGTVREVAGVLATPAAPPLFAVPGGTGNSGYRALWGTRDWADSLGRVLRGQDVAVRRIDLARLAGSGARVLLGTSVGLFAQALIAAREVARPGWARYAEALADTAAVLEPFPVTVTVDGSTIYEGDIVLANIGGGRFRAGQYQLLPHSVLDDGKLDVCVFGAEVPTARMLELTRTAQHLSLPGIRYARGERIRIERLDGQPLCYEYDGEVQPPGPDVLDVDVLAGALAMWGPPAETRTEPAGGDWDVEQVGDLAGGLGFGQAAVNGAIRGAA